MSGPGYDAWKTTPPDDGDEMPSPEEQEADALARAEADRGWRICHVCGGTGHGCEHCLGMGEIPA